MFCPKCGAQLNANYRMCPQCGAMLQAQPGNVQNNVPNYAPGYAPNSAPGYAPVNGYTPSNTVDEAAKPILVFGILSLSFSLSFFMSLLGLIFGIVGLNKAKAYLASVRSTPAKQATVGQKLSLAGTIIGAVMMAFFLFYIIFIVALVGGY